MSHYVNHIHTESTETCFFINSQQLISTEDNSSTGQLLEPISKSSTSASSTTFHYDVPSAFPNSLPYDVPAAQQDEWNTMFLGGDVLLDSADSDEVIKD